ncbi:RHS repeat-associated core domain-containing protein [Serratia sp. M24T3]|uniref:RHS repeat-associated core domain-containing protein n=1 Tax=Serratia sp. M24T3 TaxID=932213 RepID=UPI00025BB424|nr:RHS repeat-associated core domain-containing protein [Serratia sp. M24T3]EIC85006.1 hypothetical protein SPM24T3_08009 [Serratia sp. M24T3]
MTETILGFSGERSDPLGCVSHLGNGYRAYSPLLMRFNNPDSWSPFGSGGINPYAYCEGGPINRADPSGHMSWQAGLGIGLSIVGVLAAVYTGGASIAAAGSIMGALAGASSVTLVVGGSTLAADITGIASAVTEDSQPKASATLGWLSMATGILSMGAGFTGALRSSEGLVGKMAGSATLEENVENIDTNPETRVFYYDYDIAANGEKIAIGENGYIRNFAAGDNPAVIMHGKPDYLSVDGTNQVDACGMVSRVKDKFQIDLEQNVRGKSLHLISCYGNLHAQKLANRLNCPVIAYGEDTIYTCSTLKRAATGKPMVLVPRDRALLKDIEVARVKKRLFKNATATTFMPVPIPFAMPRLGFMI